MEELKALTTSLFQHNLYMNDVIAISESSLTNSKAEIRVGISTKDKGKTGRVGFSQQWILLVSHNIING